MLYDRVLPFYQGHGSPVEAILTDNGTEYKGRPTIHLYEIFLELNDIEHRTTKVGNLTLAVNSLKEGDCGPDPNFVLSDGSSAGDWRLPTMKELCTLIDYSKRDPALPNGHMF